MPIKMKLIWILLLTSTMTIGKIVRNKIIKSPNGVQMKIGYIITTQFDNKKLQGPTPIQATKVQSVAQCKAGCVRVDDCVSFNVFPDGGSLLNCHLFDTDHYIDQQLLIDETGFQYFVIKVM